MQLVNESLRDLHSNLSQASHVSGKFADGRNDSTLLQLSRHFRTRWKCRTITPPKPSSHPAAAAGNGNSSVPDTDQLVPIVSDWVSVQQTQGQKTCYSRHIGAPCVYENRRTKPGLKGGAVESLNQRLGIHQVKPMTSSERMLIENNRKGRKSIVRLRTWPRCTRL